MCIRDRTKDEEYIGPIKMTSGIFTFSFFYILWVFLFQRFIAQGDWWWSVYFAISLPIAGFFAMYYFQRIQNVKTHWRLVNLIYKKPETIGELLMDRKSIIEDLDWAKEQYLSDELGVMRDE